MERATFTTRQAALKAAVRKARDIGHDDDTILRGCFFRQVRKRRQVLGYEAWHPDAKGFSAPVMEGRA